MVPKSDSENNKFDVFLACKFDFLSWKCYQKIDCQ